MQDRARRTREQILEAAAVAFARDGYEATSLNELVRQSGLTKGAFYHHFPSKEALALATFRFKQEQVIEQTSAELRDEPDALAELRALISARARLYSRDPSARCVLRIGSELGATAGPGSEFAAFQDLTIETLSRLVRRGQAEGTIRRELDPRATAETIFGALIGVDRVSRLLAGGADLEQRGQQLAELLIAGLAPTQEPRPRNATRRQRRERSRP